MQHTNGINPPYLNERELEILDPYNRTSSLPIPIVAVDKDAQLFCLWFIDESLIEWIENLFDMQLLRDIAMKFHQFFRMIEEIIHLHSSTMTTKKQVVFGQILLA